MRRTRSKPAPENRCIHCKAVCSDRVCGACQALLDDIGDDATVPPPERPRAHGLTVDQVSEADRSWAAQVADAEFRRLARERKQRAQQPNLSQRRARGFAPRSGRV
jgi:hypothetical protein